MNWNHNYKKCISCPITVLMFSSAVLLSGCQHAPQGASGKSYASSPVAIKPSVTPVEPLTTQSQQRVAPASASGPVDACQRELAALARISPRAYAVKKARFDSLLRNAAVYTSVRGEVNAQTQDAMDALYKYKVQQVCSEIEYNVMQGLMSRGESLR